MEFKSGFVTVIGRPNVGKSTLINNIIGEKIAIISNKPQTTRNVIRMILTDDDSQIIFIDTPGIHDPRNKLGEYMTDVAVGSLKHVDAVLMITDNIKGNPISEDETILKQLEDQKTPVILILNKIDTIEKENLLPLIQEYNKKYNFKAIIPISALYGEGIDNVKDEIKQLLTEGPMYFPKDAITDQPERKIVAEYVREKILQLTYDEIPHGTGVEIVSFKERDNKNLIDIRATIYCEKESHKGILIGKKGKMLKKIGTEARCDLEGLLGTKINLQLWVKVKNDWRNRPSILNNLGYKKE